MQTCIGYNVTYSFQAAPPPAAQTSNEAPEASEITGFAEEVEEIHDEPGELLMTAPNPMEFPREELRYIGDLGDGEFGQVVLMEVTGGHKGSLALI